MASRVAKVKSSSSAAKPISAADRLRALPFKPTNGLTQKKIRKAIREVRAEREAVSQKS